MKKLSKLRLGNLSGDALDAMQKKALKGGGKECLCSCASICNCPGWDGTGPMPPSRSSSDMGTTGVNGYSASIRQSYVGN